MSMGFVKNIAKSYLNSKINSLLGDDGAEDIAITLTANDGGTQIKLPVVPENYKCSVGNKNEVVNIINAGEYLMKGKTGLKSISLSSFFPAQEYNFAPAGGDPWGIVETIESWRVDNDIVALSISGSSVDFTCLIESFEYGEQDGSGDVFYTLALREYREIGADPKKKENVTELNERKKPSFLQKVGLNALKNVINGQSPLNAISNAVGKSGLTKKQQGYLNIAKMVMRKGGISAGDVIGFNKNGEFTVNGKTIGKYDKSSVDPRSWKVH